MGERKKFYITTPIFYVNDKPHIGHAYTMIVADILARWHRLRGEDVFFLTGTDEHGEKIQKSAIAAGKTPQEFVDGIVDRFKATWKALNISYDFFIRTTDENHIETVQKFISLLQQKGDIYKGEYEGWYCVSDETFLTELELVDGKCPYCGKPVERVKEESYFFRLSKYREALLDHYKENKEFLSPSFRAQEIINRVKEGLNDLSISRTSVTWAVPFPEDDKHFVYVWLDALVNYISALGWPEGEKFREFWPADVHLIGKEINWFHSVIWPALLMSAGLPLPRMVFSHGWWTVDGKKMSKSVGNVVDPMDLLSRYTDDEIRYFLIRSMPIGQDGDFSERALAERVNGELLADLGNLVSRIIAIADKADVSFLGENILEKEINIEKIDKAFEEVDINAALEEIWSFIRKMNKYVDSTQPWRLKGEELSEVMYNLLEGLRVLSILLYPFMPRTAEKIASQLGTEITSLDDCKFKPFNGKIRRGEHLFSLVKVP
ncbi:MAG: methionine--tRNA ligase [Nanoarchaeota archaeon]|nr:methionine--tRNA ligase [Nanoarchaeota archaeon]